MNNIPATGQTGAWNRKAVIFSISLACMLLVWAGYTRDWFAGGIGVVWLLGAVWFGLRLRRSGWLTLRRNERFIMETEQMVHSLFELNPQPVAVINRQGQIIKANSAARQLSGHSIEDIHREMFDRVIVSEERKTALNHFRLALGGRPQTFETALRHKEGYKIDLIVTLVPVRSAARIDALVAVLQDISGSKRALDRIKFMAYYDDMTGIPNRRFFRERLETALQLAVREQTSVAVLYVDVDRFKLYNDSFGHDVGNMLLLQIAERLTRSVSASDVLGRMEGDEFAMFYTNAGGNDDVEQAVKRIYAEFEQPFECQGYMLHISISVGIAISGDGECDPDKLINHSDIALSKAKESGRGMFQFYNEAMDRGTLDRLTLESDLRAALQRNEFMLYYQPQVDIETGRLIGMEALIRWKHPDKGIIMPNEFIPLAEENGLIVPIGEKVIEEACRQNAAWQQAGLPPIPVSVNLSVRQFLQPNLVESIAGVLQETGLDPQYLELEITESVTLDVDYAQQALEALARLGVQISIDDFGTGYSSLSYLRKFPISRLKIDRSFVRDILDDQNDAQIVQTIIAMSRHFNMRVIAEGVETEQQLTYLRQHGCDEAQGYLFGRPAPPQTFASQAQGWRQAAASAPE